MRPYWAVTAAVSLPSPRPRPALSRKAMRCPTVIVGMESSMGWGAVWEDLDNDVSGEWSPETY